MLNTKPCDTIPTIPTDFVEAVEQSEIAPDDILDLTLIFGEAPLRLYRGTCKAETGVGLYWTPDPEAARHYTRIHKDHGVVLKAVLDTNGLSCIAMPYQDRHWSFEHLERELDIESLHEVSEQRSALLDGGYEADVIIVVNDFSGADDYWHHSILPISQKALHQMEMA